MAKFKIANVENWDIDDNPQGAVSRYATSDNRKEAARRMLAEMDSERKNLVSKHMATNTRFSSTQEQPYDFESRMAPTKHSGYESQFSEVHSEEDYEQMHQYATNDRSVRHSGYEESNDHMRDLQVDYFKKRGHGLFHDQAEALKRILKAEAEKRNASDEIKQQRELQAAAHWAEQDGMQQKRINRMFSEESPLAGMTLADLSGSKIRKTGYDETSASNFGLLDKEKMNRVAEMKEKAKQAKLDQSKAIKKAHIDPEERRAQWENYESQRSYSAQAKFGNSPIIRSLNGIMD